MEEYLHRAAALPPFLDRALELQRIDLEVLAAGAGMAFRIGAVVLVGEVLELDRGIDRQRIARRAAQVATSFFLAAVGFSARAFDLAQHSARDANAAAGP